MSLQLDFLLTVAVGIAIGLIFGFILTIRMYRNSLASVLSEFIDELDRNPDEFTPHSLYEQEEETDSPVIPIVRKSREKDFDKDKDYTINGSIQNYIRETGYTSKELEEEK